MPRADPLIAADIGKIRRGAAGEIRHKIFDLSVERDAAKGTAEVVETMKSQYIYSAPIANSGPVEISLSPHANQFAAPNSAYMVTGRGLQYPFQNFVLQNKAQPGRLARIEWSADVVLGSTTDGGIALESDDQRAIPIKPDLADTFPQSYSQAAMDAFIGRYIARAHEDKQSIFQEVSYLDANRELTVYFQPRFWRRLTVVIQPAVNIGANQSGYLIMRQPNFDMSAAMAGESNVQSLVALVPLHARVYLNSDDFPNREFGRLPMIVRPGANNAFANGSAGSDYIYDRVSVECPGHWIFPFEATPSGQQIGLYFSYLIKTYAENADYNNTMDVTENASFEYAIVTSEESEEIVRSLSSRGGD